MREQTLFKDDKRSRKKSTISAMIGSSDQSSKMSVLISYYEMER